MSDYIKKIKDKISNFFNVMKLIFKDIPNSLEKRFKEWEKNIEHNRRLRILKSIKDQYRDASERLIDFNLCYTDNLKESSRLLRKYKKDYGYTDYYKDTYFLILQINEDRKKQQKPKKRKN